MKKQLVGYVCLSMAVVMLLGGAHATYEMEIGWLVVVLGAALAVVAFRALKADPS